MDIKKYKLVAIQVPEDQGVTPEDISYVLSLCESKSGFYHFFTVEGSEQSAYVFMDFEIGDLETVEVETRTLLTPILDDLSKEREDHTYYSSFLDTEIYMFHSRKESNTNVYS